MLTATALTIGTALTGTRLPHIGTRLPHIARAAAVRACMLCPGTRLNATSGIMVGRRCGTMVGTALTATAAWSAVAQVSGTWARGVLLGAVSFQVSGPRALFRSKRFPDYRLPFAFLFGFAHASVREKKSISVSPSDQRRRRL